MSDKRTRGRPSKIDLLPDVIRDELHRLLRDKRNTQEDIRDAVNELIDAHGLSDEHKLSRTGLNRYASRMEEIGERIRQAREVSEMWVAKLGDAPTSDVGKMVQELVRTLAYDTTLKLSEGRETVSPKELNQLALFSQRIEQAAMVSHKREKEIRAAFAAQAAEVVNRAVKSAGISKETAAEIKREIMGLS
ncbi:hypothetical protein SOASR030_37370 [Leminorella grimontii]|uniref:Protein of uncharacterized function (DUF3486) n=2 Tax=Leminorella TaxID=82980 RepID=A0A2X4X5X8_9GAMM|nr:MULTISPECIES: DUF3486 family protein [Leminorella]KFC92460.1 phage terminase small subunit [Leminorella grimontii ATCC 33999 = DSM 5078]SQI34955.1 Protein of uncharacterised function (DUF3486) [Leminorella richardii]VFS54590.1 Protein of uncharacterised function (DUF3486) [Leminorella grimontii]VFS55845.1 Protein of uncharacterised function (DUF3486) [Leminorella grimontii]GKX57625.1 hypothetical protein SOASR030_37370 [Leminorella grimontii]